CAPGVLAGEQFQALLQVAADHAAHGVTVRADDLREEVAAHERLAVVFLLGDDLQQDRARDVPLGLLVDDHEVDALDHQAADVREGDVPAFDRVVQPPVRILLNSARFTHGRLPHYGLCTFRSAGRLLHTILHWHVEPNSESEIKGKTSATVRGGSTHLPHALEPVQTPMSAGPLEHRSG